MTWLSKASKRLTLILPCEWSTDERIDGFVGEATASVTRIPGVPSIETQGDSSVDLAVANR
jgi:hypothetical protein